jgi:3-phenylpropionate/cinnamic acid dioxygenase small subunit
VDIGAVIAREAIRDLVARYNSYGDAGRFDQLFALFTDDVVMETGPAGGEMTAYEGLDEVKGIFTGTKDRVADRVGGGAPGYLRHFTATHQIDLVDDDHATGRCYFAVIMDGGLDHWGRYLDRYRRVGEQWRFEHRRVLVDGYSPSSWFAG